MKSRKCSKLTRKTMFLKKHKAMRIVTKSGRKNVIKKGIKISAQSRCKR